MATVSICSSAISPFGATVSPLSTVAGEAFLSTTSTIVGLAAMIGVARIGVARIGLFACTELGLAAFILVLVFSQTG
jgi:hypothetical protein